MKSEVVQHFHLGSKDKSLPLMKIKFYKTSDLQLIYCQGASNINVRDLGRHR
ncbi:type II toxin-antitoxin system YafO family toxin [Paraglaciecola arctica]|uniref:type II toxin-antitoxin system YafO family toxin n=1 Tax=Paraglaciecola arctica TaxID=1128911 RepID=UPI001375E30B